MSEPKALCYQLMVIFFLFFAFLTTDGYYDHTIYRCYFSSPDLSDVEYIESYYFNKIEDVRFNSSEGVYVGYTDPGLKYAANWNNDKAVLQNAKAGLDSYCKHNVQIDFNGALNKAEEPKIQLKSVKHSGGSHPAMLMCSAYDFYPKTIKVSWLRDGKPVTSDVTSTEELADGDWYYQIHSHLEYTPKSGEKISCVVEHASFKQPMIYDWDPSLPESERNKVAIGASGLVLGIVLSAAGFIYYKKKSTGRILVPS